LRLKLARVSADLTDSGRLFHTVGPATEKARSPNLVLAVVVVVVVMDTDVVEMHSDLSVMYGDCRSMYTCVVVQLNQHIFYV